ncbi:MAG: DNA repair exonuclease [Clostridiales bacterium]|nr:DNA repair exonuclease [Clostridiales bacterium]
MSFRFLHVADFHLDSPFRARKEEGLDWQEALRHSFEAAVDLVLAEALHAMVVAGDLFDSENLSLATQHFLYRQLERLSAAGIPFFYVTGNHDAGPKLSRLRLRLASLPHVHVVAERKPVTLTVKDRQGQAVGILTGMGHETPYEGDDWIRGFPPAGREPLPAVAVMHAAVENLGSHPHGRYAPCRREELEALGYDYVALGHIHQRQEISRTPAIWYCGNPQGRDPSEWGEKGGLLVEIPQRGAPPQVTFRPLHRWRFERVRLAGAFADALQLKDALQKELARHPGSKDTWLLRVELAGPSPLASTLAREDERRALERELALDLGLASLELDADGLYPAVSWEKLLERGPGPLREAMAIIAELEEGDHLWPSLNLAPLAGFAGSAEEALPYLRSLLEGMREELAAYFQGGSR